MRVWDTRLSENTSFSVCWRKHYTIRVSLIQVPVCTWGQVSLSAVPAPPAVALSRSLSACRFLRHPRWRKGHWGGAEWTENTYGNLTAKTDLNIDDEVVISMNDSTLLGSWRRALVAKWLLGIYLVACHTVCLKPSGFIYASAISTTKMHLQLFKCKSMNQQPLVICSQDIHRYYAACRIYDKFTHLHWRTVSCVNYYHHHTNANKIPLCRFLLLAAVVWFVPLKK